MARVAERFEGWQGHVLDEVAPSAPTTPAEESSAAARSFRDGLAPSRGGPR